jgi:hypothetical protein
MVQAMPDHQQVLYVIDASDDGDLLARVEFSVT